MLLNECLIDELQIFVMPIILQDGIDLFENFPNLTELKQTETINHDSGAVEIKYKILT